MNEIVSIIIPVYNVADYLKECLDSVLNQTYKNFEIIIVNDGSTDNSKEIILKYKKNHPNISVIDQENQGLSEARNAGLRIAKGKYIYFLDSDDKIHDSLLEKCITIFKKYNVDLINFGYESFIGKQVIKQNKILGDSIILSGYDFFKKSAEESLGHNFNVWSYMYKKDFLIKNKLKFVKGLIYEDSELFVRILMKNPKIYILNDHLYSYRLREDSITSAKHYSLNYLTSTNIIINTYKSFMKQVPELEDIFKKYMTHWTSVKLNVLKKLEFIDKDSLIHEIYDCIQLNKILNIDLNINSIEHLKELMNTYKNVLDSSIKAIMNSEMKKLTEIRNKKLINVPLNDEKSLVGIYGISNHTKNLLEYYNDNISKINARVILIDSFSNKTYNHEFNAEVINVTDIKDYDFNCILISAFTCEDILYNNLINLGFNKKIFRLYNDNKKLLFKY